MNDLINRYELYCPIHKYQLSIGVIPLDDLDDNYKSYNLIASCIYDGLIIGDCVIVSDIEEEIEEYYKELIEKYK